VFVIAYLKLTRLPQQSYPKSTVRAETLVVLERKAGYKIPAAGRYFLLNPIPGNWITPDGLTAVGAAAFQFFVGHVD
jgi:hypothetical protein